MGHGLKALLAVVLLFVTASNAAVINIKATVPLRDSQIYQCGGNFLGAVWPPGTMCWDSGEIAFDETVVDLTQDTVNLQLDFPGPFRLQWTDDGRVSANPWLPGLDESASASTYNAANPQFFNARFGNSISFVNPEGNLLANDINSSVVGGSGGLFAGTQYSYGGPYTVGNLTDSAFSFTGITFGMGPYACVPTDYINCVRPTNYTLNTARFFLGSGLFSIIRPAPEPGTLALLGLGLAALGLSRRRSAN